MSTPNALLDHLDAILAPHGLHRRPPRRPLGEVEGATLFVKKSFNVNRAVAVLSLPPGQAPGPFAQAHKYTLGRAVGYLPLFYALGLQVVLLTSDPHALSADLRGSVDKFDNQRCVLQSLFVYDPASGRGVGTRTWGQVFTGRVQETIAAALGVQLPRR